MYLSFVKALDKATASGIEIKITTNPHAKYCPATLILSNVKFCIKVPITSEGMKT